MLSKIREKGGSHLCLLVSISERKQIIIKLDVAM